MPGAASTKFVGVVGGALASEGLLAVTTSVVVTPSARERFTPRELTDAYQQFKERGPQYVSAETASEPQRTGLASVCSSFTKNLRRA